MIPTNPFLLTLSLGLQAADLLLGQRHCILLLLGCSQPELKICYLPLQFHDPGALRYSGHLQGTQAGGMNMKEDPGRTDRSVTWGASCGANVRKKKKKKEPVGGLNVWPL